MVASSSMSKASILGRSATFMDLEQVPEGLIGEILEGDLWVSPHPASRHSHTLVTLTTELVPPFQHGNGGPGGWHLLSEMEVFLGGDVLVPDLAGWRRDRKLRLMDQTRIIDIPDWVCEILSKSTEKIDRGLKARIYARAGIRHMWLVDPHKRTIEVFRLAANGWVHTQMVEGDAIAVAEPFEAAGFPLSRIWTD